MVSPCAEANRLGGSDVSGFSRATTMIRLANGKQINAPLCRLAAGARITPRSSPHGHPNIVRCWVKEEEHRQMLGNQTQTVLPKARGFGIPNKVGRESQHRTNNARISGMHISPTAPTYF